MLLAAPFALVAALVCVRLAVGPGWGVLPLLAVGPAVAAALGGIGYVLAVGAEALVVCAIFLAAEHPGSGAYQRAVVAFLAVIGVTAAGCLASAARARRDRALAHAREVQYANQRLREVNAELSRATEALREQQRAKDRFVATLSHELRNPLAAIRAAVDLLTLDRAGGRPPAVGVLDRQVTVLTRMADDLLDASRALTGRLTVARERLDLREVIDEVTWDLRPGFDQAQRTLTVTVPRDAVPVDGDRVRLAQLLGNLLSNALAYTRPGATITVWLTAEPATAAGAPGHATLVVRDDGIGFEPAEAETLFEVFVRAAPAQAATGGLDPERVPAGLGLGLGLVRSIAELHGGTACARSEGPGKGAEFTVRLPLARPVRTHARQPGPAFAPLQGLPAGGSDQLPANPAPSPLGPGPPPAGRQHPAGRRPLDVLVIEDNADLAASYQHLLERRGDRVTLADTGGKGLSAAQARPFDLILCDIALPDSDGRDIARQLRAHPRRRQMRLIAVSGFTQAADRQRSLAAGFDAHLAKPITIADLDVALSGWSPA